MVIRGADSLPYRPGDAVISSYPTGDVRNVQDRSVSLSWQKGDPIVEPQGDRFGHFDFYSMQMVTVTQTELEQKFSSPKEFV
ncbi:hypothetical protein [Scytonema sp. NUACC26]|uniref:hypothetical protein n=1 Tax=Scytonema sp. NUACC26 TaxID=3140176 RepID=UPI0034DC18CF